MNVYRIVAFMMVLAACAVFGGTGIEIVVMDRDGMRPVSSAEITLETRRSVDADGAETVVCKLTSQTDSACFVRLEARFALPAETTTLFDGAQEFAATDTTRTNALLLGAFPMGAAWGKKGARALALGVEAGDSYADLIMSPCGLVISVHAGLLRKGSVYETVFHAFDFNPKYGTRDAFARYYVFYPRRFTRDPAVDPALNGICAHYASWRRADPETCRFMNATWDLCIGASRTWGDIIGREQPTGPRNTAYSWDEETGYVNRNGCYSRTPNSQLTREQFNRILDERLAFGYYCGVINAYYVMALANISNEIAKRHPDSIAVGHTFRDNSYLYSTEVFPFPECSWGRDVREQFEALAQTSDIGAVYFDVSRGRGVYRGERLKEMKNVSWDSHGAGIVRAVASAKLFDFVRTLKAKKSGYRLGTSINTKFAHLSDVFYVDQALIESCPWDYEKPFPINARLALGEKGLHLWEGFSTSEFDPNFKNWPPAAQDQLINALARFAVHASFRTGAQLPACYLCEYTTLMSHAMVWMNEAGWKPVPGAVVQGDGWELARYGLGDKSYLAVNNLTNIARRATVEVFPAEIISGRAGGVSQRGILYAAFFGGVVEIRMKGGHEEIGFTVGPQLAAVLEAVGECRGKGTLSAEWSGDFDAVTLNVVSTDFTGDIALRDSFGSYVREGAAERRLVPGDKLRVIFRNEELKGVLGQIHTTKVFKVVRHAPDADSKDMAERIAFFLKCAANVRIEVAPDGGMKTLSVSLEGIEVSADDRWELSRRVSGFLNVLNRTRYPEYRPKTPMENSNRAYYPWLRL